LAEVCFGVEVEQGDVDSLSRLTTDDPRGIVARCAARLMRRHTGDSTGRKTGL